MAYDEDRANQVRTLIGGKPGLTEKRMFGGLAFLLNGHMAVVVRGKGGLLVRVDPAHYEALLDEPGAEEPDMGGRNMTGWIVVTEPGCTTAADLRRWVSRGVKSAAGLPPK